MKNNQVTRSLGYKVTKSVCLCVMVALCFFFIPQLAQAATTNQISQFGITWTFDKAYEYGQFANGDYWVVGPIKIIGINPPSLKYQFRFDPNASGISGTFSIDEPVFQTGSGASGKVITVTGQGDVFIEPDPLSTNFVVGLPITTSAGDSFIPELIEDRVVNGAIINPAVNGGQGFDSEMHAWHTTTNRPYPGSRNYIEGDLINENVARKSGAPLSDSNYLQVLSGVSLISCISKSKPARTILDAQAILTILDSAPSEGSFRPPYSGADKTVEFNKSDVDYGALQNLASVAGAPSLNTYEQYFERPWIDFQTGQRGQSGRSVNMPEYSQDIGMRTGTAALLLNIRYSEDLLENNLTKEILLVRLIQLGIDNYGVMASNRFLENGVWNPIEGQNMGHKLPIVFAGRMLNDTEMLNIGTWWTTADHVQGSDGNWYMCILSHTSSASNKPISGGSYSTYWRKVDSAPARCQKAWSVSAQYSTGHVFQEDLNVFYVAESDIDRYVKGVNKSTGSAGPDAVIGTDGNWYRCIYPVSHIATADNQPINGANWQSYWEYTHSVPNRNQKTWVLGNTYAGHTGSYKADQYKEEHLGIPEWGARHFGPYPDMPTDDAGWDTAGYRSMCTIGMASTALAIHTMGLKGSWDRDAFLDYMDRWYTLSTPPTWSSSVGAFTMGMWNNYRADYGPIWPATATVIYGDVDGNGEVSAYDAALTAQAAVGLITLTAEQIQAADVSGEGEVSAYDAALIAQKAVGLINKFPVEG